MTRRVAVACAVALGTATMAQRLRSQEPEPITGSALCLLGTAPAPQCERFLVTEIALHPRRTVEGQGSASYLTWEVGIMANAGRNAGGGALFAGVDGLAGARLGIKGRYRRWLGSRASIDATAGVLLARFGDWWDNPSVVPSASGSVAVNLTDALGVILTIEDVVSRDPETRHAVTFLPGIKVGGWPGMVTTAALFAVAALVAAGGGIGFD